MTVEFPIIAVVGDRGDGKTLSMVALAHAYYVLGFKIYANFTIYGIEYTKVNFDYLAEFPDDLHDGVILMDENHVGMDAYDAFLKRVKNITLFTTQLRKRRLILMYSTQIFTQVSKRLRNLTNYIFECKGTDIKGVIRVSVYDRNAVEDVPSHRFYLDGRQFFKSYDTNELIQMATN